MMKYALSYAADGFAVFPVYEPEKRHSGYSCSCGKADCRGKHPRTANGVKDATTDANQIKEWWNKWPSASIGIATGKISGIAVVDLDGPEGMASGNRLHLVSQVTALTGNGKQLYFSDSSGLLANSVKKLADGVDTRGNLGYVIAPPSLHPNGKRYMWEKQPLSRKALGAIPSHLLITRESGGRSLISRKPEGWLAEALKGMKVGNIDNTLVSVLGRFKHDGYTEAEAVHILTPHAKAAGATAGHLEEKAKYLWAKYPSVVKQISVSKSETIDTFLQHIQEPSWIVKPFVASKSIGFVVGLPAVHKTWALMDLAIECARPSGSWFGMYPTKQSRVLFIDLERYKGETQRRFSAMIAAKGLTSEELESNLYLKCGTTIRLDLQESFDAFRSELLELRPDIVMVDSFAAIHSSQENDRSAIQQIMEKLKSLRQEIGCDIVMINHENKMAYPNGEPQGVPTMGTMLGSTGIAAAAEFILIIRKVDDITAVVHHVKSTLASSQQAFYFTTTDENGGTVVRGLPNA